MQRYESKGSITSVTSLSRGGEKKIPPTHMIVQRDNDNQLVLLPLTHLVNGSVTRIKVNSTVTFKSDLTNREQERGRVIILGSKEVCMEQLQVFEMVADIGSQNIIDNDNGKVNKNQEHEKTRKVIVLNEISFWYLEKQFATSFDGYKHVSSGLVAKPSTSSIKQVTNIVKEKHNIKSKYLSLDDDMNGLSSNEDEEVCVSSNDSSTNNILSNELVSNSATVVPKTKITNSSTNDVHIDYQDEPTRSTKSKIIISSQSRNNKNSSESNTTTLDSSSFEQEEQVQDMNDADIVCRYEFLSKKCNKLSKENAELQLECDRLTTENQVLKRTTMPIPDAAGRQWIINMGQFFSRKVPGSNIAKYATALGIDDPRDQIACIEDTTSNTTRQVIRLLYSSDKLLTMSGTEVPQSRRSAIRAFAESQKGPISKHKFNEAINGVFRSKKNEFKNQQSGNSNKSNKKSVCLNTGEKTSKQVLNKNQQLQSGDPTSDKENTNVRNNHEDN
ncbi:unnamed protein product [Rotaria magnacalcarata]|uniref:BEN domain-containing protein n=1 Tax=Rotaria magnacalcarata TaxID=392030 RepID=A0A816WR36_9BILA|nr:unnamed protein product [Rotaria magnacalcarata]